MVCNAYSGIQQCQLHIACLLMCHRVHGSNPLWCMILFLPSLQYFTPRVLVCTTVCLRSSHAGRFAVISALLDILHVSDIHSSMLQTLTRGTGSWGMTSPTSSPGKNGGYQGGYQGGSGPPTPEGLQYQHHTNSAGSSGATTPAQASGNSEWDMFFANRCAYAIC